MRLIRTDDPELRLEEFNEQNTPEYAILSHTWGDEELEFKDLPLDARSSNHKSGRTKVIAFCTEVLKRDIKHAWVDTCCINKSSTTELSEAINSMYKWYQRAVICIAYLSDYEADVNQFRESRWFKRGWTLQELIAPRYVDFYDKKWCFIGNKTSLKTEISSITEIDEKVLEGADPRGYSIAQRMSWAAGRQTTRSEDIAYCLLGLFEVNLPMIYGLPDSRSAFLSLQEEIMKRSADHSLFAWDQAKSDAGASRCGLLALSPDMFAGCSDVVPSLSSELNTSGYGMTNVGLILDLYTTPIAMHMYLAVLDCTNTSAPHSRFAIFVERLADKNQYARVRYHKTKVLIQDYQRIKARKLCFRQQPGVPSYCRWMFDVFPILLPTNGVQAQHYNLEFPSGVDKHGQVRQGSGSGSSFIQFDDPNRDYNVIRPMDATIVIDTIARQLRETPDPSRVPADQFGKTNPFQVCGIAFGFNEAFAPRLKFWVKDTELPSSPYCHKRTYSRSYAGNPYQTETTKVQLRPCIRPRSLYNYTPQPRPGIRLNGDPCYEPGLHPIQILQRFEFSSEHPTERTLILGDMAVVELKLELKPCSPPLGKTKETSESGWEVWTVHLKVKEILYHLSHLEAVRMGLVKPCGRSKHIFAALRFHECDNEPPVEITSLDRILLNATSGCHNSMLDYRHPGV